MSKIYKCQKCGKIFKGRNGYEYHIYKIGTPCNMVTNRGNDESKKSQLSKLTVINPAGSKSITIKSEKGGGYQSDENPLNFFSILKKDGNTEYHCKLCGKVYVSEKFLKLHIEKKWCFGGNKNTNFVETLINAISKNENKNKKNIIINNHVHHHVTNNVNNNTVTNNNITNNITNNNIINNNSLSIYQNGNEIKINAFGKENLDILTPELMDKIVEHPSGGIIKLIKTIHFNPEVPENMNVVLKNKNDPYFNVFNGEIWELKPKDVTIHNLLTTKKDIMDDHFEVREEKKLIGMFFRQNYSTFSDLLDPILRKGVKYELGNCFEVAVNEEIEGKIHDEVENSEKDEQEKKQDIKTSQRLYRQLYKGITLLMFSDNIKIDKKKALA